MTVLNVDECNLTCLALVTWPQVDKDGMYVVPSGGRFHLHKRYPSVNVGHLYQTDGGDWKQLSELGNGAGWWNHEPLIAAWTRESLSEPGGEYSVRPEPFTIDGKVYRVPVAKCFFDAHDRFSMQVFDSIARRRLTGVSAEFFERRVTKAIQRHPWNVTREAQREYRRVEKWDFTGLAFTSFPRNTGARIVACDYEPRSLSRR